MNEKSKDQFIQVLIALFTRGEIDKCQVEAQKAVKIYPTEPFLFNILGITHASSLSFVESINNYKKAIIS